MTILGQYSTKDFLENYWQKQPLLIRGASLDYESVISADELAGMACEEQVESRLIIESGGRDNEPDWCLENGPLEEARFAELPEKHWTLLVQSVDQWIPEVKDILKEFDFLPSWRLDDVMISYATPEGGVGPHFDYYDVFLLQTNGQRRWKIGQQCDSKTPLLEGQPLKLLEEFKQTDQFDLEPGDMLYIPAGLAHWGTGLDDQCMTWSIGFRAPSAKELLSGAIDIIADQLPDDLRYRDSIDSLLGQKGEISTAVHGQLKSLGSILTEDLLVSSMHDVLGAMATEPRYPELIEELSESEPWTEEELRQLFTRDHPEGVILELNSASRLAYREIKSVENMSKFYVNGDIWEVRTDLARMVCTGNVGLVSFSSDSGQVLLLKLLNAGVYNLED